MDERELRKKVRDIMFLNLQAGYSHYLKTHFVYNKPSFERYPYQWWWDTCFHVYILCALEEFELAKQNLMSLFAMQEPDGFVGHMVYWQLLLPKNIFTIIEAKRPRGYLRPHMSALIQPSFVAQALERIYEKTGDKEFLTSMLPKIKKYHDWVISKRAFDGDSLITIIAPVESGIDWKPSYDEVLKFSGGPANWKLYFKMVYSQTRNFLDKYDLQRIKNANRFLVKDVGVNTINALDLYALSRLCRIAKDGDGNSYEAHAIEMSARMLEVMYDEADDAFYDVYGPHNIKLKVVTPTILFPMALPKIPTELSKRMVIRYLKSEEHFALPFSIPSVSKSEKSFVPGRQHFRGQEFLWRGPTWAFYNWFLFRCLKEEGFVEEARKLREAIISLIEKSGFCEYYNPLTGEGYGAERFTWSGLVLDMEI